MSAGRFFRQVVNLKERFSEAPELPFSKVLSKERIERVLDELKVVYRERIYSPCVTLWLFVGQVLSGDQSCRNAVAQLLAFRAARGLPGCSSETGSYCQARERLPEELVSRLVKETGNEMHEQTPDAWRLHGRPIKDVDGSTISMPDTVENEAAFGKPRNQRGKSGFPLARIVFIFCLATGFALEAAIGRYRGKNTGELTLFRSIQGSLKKGDIVLGDRLFCTFVDIVRLTERGVDVVFRQHTHRCTDFRRGKKLGPEDHLVTWTKPGSRPDWMSREEYAALPDGLLVREVRVHVMIPGFRTKSIIVVTTLTDVDKYSKHDLAELFRQRWQAELDIRSIKTFMQMDVCRCKTPEMVRKEIWIHLLAYNLIRSVMCSAALENELPVREISFKGTMQFLNSFRVLLTTSHPSELEALCTILLRAVCEHRVGNRPDRYEPRKIKRAAKPYPAMKLSRNEERKRCLRKGLA
jgi:Transposase DDE domain